MSKKKSIALHCLLCGKPTGTELKVGDIKLAPEEDKDAFLAGVCPECAGHLEDGGVFFTDADDRVIKVSLEASKTKIAEAFRGRVIKLPKAAFREVLAVWEKDQASKSGNGDVTPAVA